MGILDKILKDEVTKTISKQIKSQIKKIPTNSANNTETKPTVSADYYTENQEAEKVPFDVILAEDFSDYEIKENIAKEEFGGSGRACEFGLFKDDKLKAVVVLVTNKNETTRKEFRAARVAAESAGVGFVSFYTFMPNQREYVITRIKSFL